MNSKTRIIGCFVAGVFLLAVDLKTEAASVTLQPYTDWPDSPVLETVNPFTVTRAASGLRNNLSLEQSFTLTETLTVGRITLAVDGYDPGIDYNVRFYQMGGSGANSSSLADWQITHGSFTGTQVGNTISITSEPSATQTGYHVLQIDLASAEQVTLAPGEYFIAFTDLSGQNTLNSFSWVLANTGSDLYSGGRYYDGSIKSQQSYRDYGLALDTAWEPATWRASHLTGDSDSDVSSAYTYTCAVKINDVTGSDLNISGVTFENTSASSGTSWEIMSGFSSTHAGESSTVSGDIANVLGGGMRYQGDPQSLRLTGLTAGQSYVFSVYCQAWSTDSNPRTALLSLDAASETLYIDEDYYYSDAYDGLLIQCEYIARDSDVIFTFDPDTANTWHLYGFSNRQGIIVPTSSGVDLRAYHAAGGVYVEFVAYDVESDGTIMLALVGEDGEIVWSGSVEVTAGPQSVARFLVPGLEPGQSYDFLVRDEVGQWWDADGVTVASFASDLMEMTLTGLTISFNSLPEREYDIQWTSELGSTWQTVTNVTATAEQTSVVVEYPESGEAIGFFRVLAR